MDVKHHSNCFICKQLILAIFVVVVLSVMMVEHSRFHTKLNISHEC